MQRNEIVPVDEQAVALLGHVAAPYERPVTMYLGTVSAGSRMTLLASLNTAARLLGTERRDQLVVDRRAPLDVTAFWCPWPELDYETLVTLRRQMEERYTFTSTNKVLSAIRGVLKACWHLGLMEGERYRLTIEVPAARGENLPAGREIKPGEIVGTAPCVCQGYQPPGTARCSAHCYACRLWLTACRDRSALKLATGIRSKDHSLFEASEISSGWSMRLRWHLRRGHRLARRTTAAADNATRSAPLCSDAQRRQPDQVPARRTGDLHDLDRATEGSWHCRVYPARPATHLCRRSPGCRRRHRDRSEARRSRQCGHNGKVRPTTGSRKEEGGGITAYPVSTPLWLRRVRKRETMVWSTPWVAEQQGLIQTPNDLLNLHLIDFSRLNGYWPNELEAIESICSWIVGTTNDTVVRCESSATFPTSPIGQTGSILGRTTKNLPASIGTCFTLGSSVR